MATISTIADIVRAHAAASPEREAIRLGDRALTWAELSERSSRCANALAARGVSAGDRVAFLDKNSIERFEVMYAAAMLGAVSVDVNWRLAPAEIAYIVSDSQAKAFVVGADFTPALEAMGGALPADLAIVVLGDDYEAALAGASGDDPAAPSGPDDVVFQMYSSGTTGLPKGVMLTNANFFSILTMSRDLWGFSPESVNLIAMPLFHIAGSGWAVVGQYWGCRSILVRDLDPVAVIRLITEMRVTHALFVPAVLQFLLMVPGVDEADLSSLQTIVYGASPISEDVLVRSMRLFGCDFWQAYGLTETTGTVVNLAPADHDPEGPRKHLLRSCGRPGPGVEIRIVEPDVETANTAEAVDCAVGAVGEIWIRSPQVMAGYWNLPEATATSITADGWFRSGDMGYVDADGYVYVHDRLKDMIVSGGENVYPAEVENALASHPDVADVAVIGVPDDRWGETVKAIIVRRPGSELTEAELIEFSRSRLARYKCPTSVDWIEMLPRNPSGKILKRELRAPYWTDRTRQVN